MDAELRHVDGGVVPVHRLEDVVLIGLCFVVIFPHAAEQPAGHGRLDAPEGQIGQHHLVNSRQPAQVARLAHAAQEAAHGFFGPALVNLSPHLPAPHAALPLHQRVQIAVGALDDAQPFGHGHDPGAVGADEALGAFARCRAGRDRRTG